MAPAPESVRAIPFDPGGAGSMPVRVVVLSRHQLTRAGLTQLLNLDCRRASVVDVPSQVGHLNDHDVAVYDLAGLIGASGNVLEHLLATDIPVVALAPQARPDLAEAALAMGVAATVSVDVTAEELLVAVERAAAGHVIDLASYRRERRERLRVAKDLTDREMCVLELVAAGLPNREIAEELFVSINTVKTYIRIVYRKIRVTTRPEAVLWCVRHGLTPPQCSERGA